MISLNRYGNIQLDPENLSSPVTDDNVRCVLRVETRFLWRLRGKIEGSNLRWG